MAQGIMKEKYDFEKYDFEMKIDANIIEELRKSPILRACCRCANIKLFTESYIGYMGGEERNEHLQGTPTDRAFAHLQHFHDIRMVRASEIQRQPPVACHTGKLGACIF